MSKRNFVTASDFDFDDSNEAMKLASEDMNRALEEEKIPRTITTKKVKVTTDPVVIEPVIPGYNESLDLLINKLYTYSEIEAIDCKSKVPSVIAIRNKESLKPAEKLLDLLKKRFMIYVTANKYLAYTFGYRKINGIRAVFNMKTFSSLDKINNASSFWDSVVSMSGKYPRYNDVLTHDSAVRLPDSSYDLGSLICYKAKDLTKFPKYVDGSIKFDIQNIEKLIKEKKVEFFSANYVKEDPPSASNFDSLSATKEQLKSLNVDIHSISKTLEDIKSKKPNLDDYSGLLRDLNSKSTKELLVTLDKMKKSLEEENDNLSFLISKHNKEMISKTIGYSRSSKLSNSTEKLINDYKKKLNSHIPEQMKVTIRNNLNELLKKQGYSDSVDDINSRVAESEKKIESLNLAINKVKMAVETSNKLNAKENNIVIKNHIDEKVDDSDEINLYNLIVLIKVVMKAKSSTSGEFPSLPIYTKALRYKLNKIISNMYSKTEDTNYLLSNEKLSDSEIVDEIQIINSIQPNASTIEKQYATYLSSIIKTYSMRYLDFFNANNFSKDQNYVISYAIMFALCKMLYIDIHDNEYKNYDYYTILNTLLAKESIVKTITPKIADITKDIVKKLKLKSPKYLKVISVNIAKIVRNSKEFDKNIESVVVKYICNILLKLVGSKNEFLTSIFKILFTSYKIGAIKYTTKYLTPNDEEFQKWSMALRENDISILGYHTTMKFY